VGGGIQDVGHADAATILYDGTRNYCPAVPKGFGGASIYAQSQDAAFLPASQLHCDKADLLALSIFFIIIACKRYNTLPL